MLCLFDDCIAIYESKENVRSVHMFFIPQDRRTASCTEISVGTAFHFCLSQGQDMLEFEVVPTYPRECPVHSEILSACATMTEPDIIQLPFE